MDSELEMTFKIINGNGYHLEIAPDKDTGELIEIVYYESPGKPLDSICLTYSEARLMIEALTKLINYKESETK